MNSTAVIQIPVQTALKTEATAAAKELGFSSLQELLRVLMVKLAAKDLKIAFSSNPQIKLSPKSDRRYSKIERDFKKGKNTIIFEDLNKALAYLNEN